MYVFVYGTLKKGKMNNYLLSHPNKGNADFVKTATISKEAGLSMVDFGGFPAVYLSNYPNKIVGEIWDVKNEKIGLRLLDALERYPTMYDRGTIEVDGYECVIYFMHESYDDYYKIEEWDV